MKSTPASKPDNFSARIDLRVDPVFKKKFIKFCKDNQISSSDAAREALHQYSLLGDFKKQLFEFLCHYSDARELFGNFLARIPPVFPKEYSCSEIGSWFEELLGPEEKKLIDSTPTILLKNIQNMIITESGKTALKERLSSSN